jgi:hypothetical protein
VSEKNTVRKSADGDRPKPHGVRLPGFIKDEDVGLGDVISRATSIVGIRPCSGCAERASRLNKWMVFSKQ